MSGRRRALLAAVVLVLVAGGVAAWAWPQAWEHLFGPAAEANSITVSGNIEAHEAMLSFTQVQAPIVELPFDEGATVARDTVIARVDDRLYRQQTAIDRTSLDAATAQVAVAESNLVAARTTVSSDEFDLSEKQRDYARAQQTVGTATTAQARDLAWTAAQQSAQTLARDQAMVQVADNNLTLARANAANAQEKLQFDEITLGYTTLHAPFAGVIAVRQAELGQLAGPGVAIVTLDDLDHPWLRAYINEPDIGKVRLGQAVTVTTDTYPGKTYQGRISFISPNAEFTPKTVETHAERVTLVYRIRIDVANPTHELLPGMPADAAIPLLPPGS